MRGASAVHARTAGEPRGHACHGDVTVADATLHRRSGRARSTGPTKGFWWSPICIWKKARPSPGAACCCRPTIPRRRSRGSRILIERHAPRIVIALGDSFHDGHGPARMHDTDRASLRALQRGRDWIWIAGNHDPELAGRHRRRFARMYWRSAR